MPSPSKAAKAKDRDEVTSTHRKTPRERELEREKAAKLKAAEAKAASKATKSGKPAAKAEPVKEEKNEKADRSDKKESSSASRAAVKAVSKAAEAKPAPKPVKVNYKSPFSASELADWRKLLTSRRNEISSDIAGLEKDAMEAEDGHTTPNHIAERGSDADLQDVSLGIAGEEKDLIWQIDRALEKIVTGQPIPFGLCEYSKEPISKNRLQLIPWTPLSIEGATYLEENGLTVEDIMEE